jgi:hypothetical protein
MRSSARGRHGAFAVLLAAALAFCLAPATALALGGGQLPECQHGVVRDYLSPFRGLPKLPNPAFELPRRFGPPGLELRQPENLLNHGRFDGYTVEFLPPDGARIDWRMTATLSRIDAAGRAIGAPLRRRRRLRFVKADRSIGFVLPGKPALYRIELGIRDGASGKPLGSYGEYVRVVRRRLDPHVVLAPPVLKAGETAAVGVAEYGTGLLDFIDTHYSVEVLDGSTWAETPIEVHTPSQDFGLYAAYGELTYCSTVSVPFGAAPGRYRVIGPVEHTWGVPAPHRFSLAIKGGFWVVAG